MDKISATEQKIGKLSVESSFSNDSQTDFSSPYAAQYSILTHEDLKDLILPLQQALGLPVCSFQNLISIQTLKSLIAQICSEHSQAKTHEINLKNSQPAIEEVSVNLLNTKQSDPITRIFSMPKESIELSSEDCKNFSALIIGAIRDSSSHYLQRKNQELQEKVIELAFSNLRLKQEIKDKIEEIQNIEDRVGENRFEGSYISKKFLISESTKSIESSIDRVT